MRIPKKGWKYEDYSGVKRISKSDYNNMAEFVAYGTFQSLRNKVREWDKRGLKFSDEVKYHKIQANFWELKFKGNTLDFEEE